MSNIFTDGLYTLDQAARIAQVSPQLLRNWLGDTPSRTAALERKMPANAAGVIGFIDLIQAMAVHAIRVHKNVSLQKIRAAVGAAHKRGIEYPFARNHQTFLFSDEVVIKILAPEEILIYVTGKYKDQQLIPPI